VIYDTFLTKDRWNTIKDVRSKRMTTKPMKTSRKSGEIPRKREEVTCTGGNADKSTGAAPRLLPN